MTNLSQRYDYDPVFHSLVDTLVAAIERGQFTPNETREAAMLAQILYEERNPRPMIFTKHDVFMGKV